MLYLTADSRSLSVITRPRSEVPEWSVFPARTHVVLERQGAGFRHSYRVLVENPTDSTLTPSGQRMNL